MTTGRNITERRGAKFPFHKNIKPVLSPDLDSPLFVCNFFKRKFVSSVIVTALKVNHIINLLKV